MKKYYLLPLLLFLSAFIIQSVNGKNKKNMTDKNSQPKSEIVNNSIHGESIVISGNSPATFLFNKIIPDSVVVRNNYDAKAKGNIIYKKGEDYLIDCKNGAIKRTEKSRIPDYSKHSLFGVKNFDYTKVKNYSNQPFFIWVDYKTENNADISIPVLYQKNIKKTLDILNKNKPLKIIVFGDSISTGGEVTEPRFAFYERFKKSLQEKYPKSKITMENGSTGGDTTRHGLERLNDKVLTRKPDLVIVGFGMNDHNINFVAPKEFHKNLKSIVKQIKNKTGADVLLYSTFPPNPEWNASSHNMKAYAEATKKVAKETKSAYADVYSIWKNALKRKDPPSLLNNNINHPNNFGHWMYSQAFIIE